MQTHLGCSSLLLLPLPPSPPQKIHQTNPFHLLQEIAIPCTPHAGFSTCPHFIPKQHTSTAVNTTIRKPTHKHLPYPTTYHEGLKKDCPWHSLKGDYDFNRIRMVETKLKWWPVGLVGMPPR